MGPRHKDVKPHIGIDYQGDIIAEKNNLAYIGSTVQRADAEEELIG